jgi:hypothetical protein
MVPVPVSTWRRSLSGLFMGARGSSDGSVGGGGGGAEARRKVATATVEGN